MPIRKNDNSKSGPADDGLSITRESLPGVGIEDLNLPKSIVTRLAKGVLPANTQIQSNAMLGLTRSATLFINYIASQANETAAASNRKTVTANDVFAALQENEFASWKPRLEAELEKFTQVIEQRKEKVRSKETDGAPVAKKIKRGRTNSTDKANIHQSNPDKKSLVDKWNGVSTSISTATGEQESEDEKSKEETEKVVEGEDNGGDDEDDEDEDENENEDGDEDEEALGVEEQENHEEGDDSQITDEALDNGEDSD